MNIRRRFQPNPDADHVLRVLTGLLFILLASIAVGFIVILILAIGWWIFLAPVVVVAAICVCYLAGWITEALFS